MTVTWQWQFIDIDTPGKFVNVPLNKLKELVCGDDRICQHGHEWDNHLDSLGLPTIELHLIDERDCTNGFRSMTKKQTTTLSKQLKLFKQQLSSNAFWLNDCAPVMQFTKTHGQLQTTDYLITASVC